MCADEFVAYTSDPIGHLYNYPEAGGTADPAYKQYTHIFVMESLGFPLNWVVRPIIILLAFILAFFFGAGLLLRFFKVEVGISQAQKTDGDSPIGMEATKQISIEEVRRIEQRLEKHSLKIKRRRPWLEQAQDLPILKPISATFEPGTLNVIMMPSGSGKTSLLNMLANRIYKTATTLYRTSGVLYFPFLLVRQNIRFAAGLQLPASYTKLQKLRRAKALLLEMGLRDVADDLIGSELAKGISRGETRRVTIALQILTDPKVPFLDEPTSGLDFFTASSIISVLKGLAEEGRTLIATMHQSRSDVSSIRQHSPTVVCRLLSNNSTESSEKLITQHAELWHERLDELILGIGR